MSNDNRGPFIVAYRVWKPDRFGYVRVSFSDENPQKTAFEETTWATVCPEIIFVGTAAKPDGGILTEKDFHKYLKSKGYEELHSRKHSEGWYLCSKEEIEEAYSYLMEPKGKWC